MTKRTNMKTSVIITGAAGRMGKTLVARALSMEGLQLAGATEQKDAPSIGQDAGVFVGLSETGVLLSDSLDQTLKSAGTGVVIIDFTSPKALESHLSSALARSIPIVIGTTGMDDTQRATITTASKKIPIVLAPNMSIGVNTLFGLTAQAAGILKDSFDMEVFEAHHKLKKDAPSGTAVRLAEILAENTSRSYPDDIVFHREGLVGERTQKEIGMQVLRGGDIVGEHTVFFCGNGERIELTHRATNRQTFADGALRAACWIVGQKPGLYTMQHVLGFA